MLQNLTIFELTEKGKQELSAAGGLSGDAKFILPLFGRGWTLAEVAGKLPPSVRACCVATVNNLITDGYIVAGAEAAEAMQQLNFVTPGNQQPDDKFVGRLVEEDAGLDFTGKFPTAIQVSPEDEKLIEFVVPESLEEEIESRSQQLAIEKIRQYEEDMNNTLTRMAEHEILLAEREKLAKQQAMVESARLSPIYENLRELLFFKDFRDAELAEVLHIGVWNEMNEHDALIREGDKAESFYVMLKGFAGVFKRDRLIGLVQSGESFGEFSFLMGDEETHHADVIARSHVEFMGFSTEKLARISVEARLQFAAAFSRCQTRRLVCANEQIVNLLTNES